MTSRLADRLWCTLGSLRWYLPSSALASAGGDHSVLKVSRREHIPIPKPAVHKQFTVQFSAAPLK